MNRREELFDRAYEAGIEVINALPGDGSKRGIHLLAPDLDEFEDALDVAERDGFTAIYIHTGDRFENPTLNKSVKE